MMNPRMRCDSAESKNETIETKPLSKNDIKMNFFFLCIISNKFNFQIERKKRIE